MAQHDYNIANASGASVRADLNNAFSAIVSLNSGATAPTTTFAYMLWADTTTGLLKIRNAGNSAWTTVGTIASANLGLVVGPTSGGTTADQVLATNGSGVQSWVDRARLTRGTSQNSTTGTSITFTGIPSWARKITVMLKGVSTNGTNGLLVQAGISTGPVNTGYASVSTSSTPTTSSNTSGFLITPSDITAASTVSGNIIICNPNGNDWVAHSVVSRGDASYLASGAGSVSLSAVLDRVVISTTTGTDTFDTGTINIMYEG